MPVATVEGRFLNAEGKPLPGVAVHFLPDGWRIYLPDAHTDADGRFSFEMAPGVVGRLSAQDPSNFFKQTTREHVASGARDIVLQLPR